MVLDIMLLSSSVTRYRMELLFCVSAINSVSHQYPVISRYAINALSMALSQEAPI
jgi:hypothetical protein